MRQHNSPLAKSNNIYKSSATFKKVNPQQTILSSNMIESKRQLNTVRSQQLLRSTSQHGQRLIDSKRKLTQTSEKNENNFAALRSSQKISLQKMDKPGNTRTEEKAYTFENEDQYIGEWAYDQLQKKEKLHGYGCYKFKKQKLQYRGYFKNGFMHGSGTLHRLLSRGKPEIIYEGEWMNGQKNGSGKYYYDENIHYEGNWNRNRKQGKGKFKSLQGEYDGLWVNDLKHGQGVLRLTNGTVYEGEWENDEFLAGEVRYSNGDIYRGQMNERFERHLQGQYSLASKQETYKGLWRNNRKEGQGEILYNMNGERYLGPMKNDNREGSNCIYEWKNGTKAVCSFENNFPVRGKIIMPDNSSFDFDCSQPLTNGSNNNNNNKR